MKEVYLIGIFVEKGLEEIARSSVLYRGGDRDWISVNVLPVAINDYMYQGYEIWEELRYIVTLKKGNSIIVLQIEDIGGMPYYNYEIK